MYRIYNGEDICLCSTGLMLLLGFASPASRGLEIVKMLINYIAIFLFFGGKLYNYFPIYQQNHKRDSHFI